MGLGEQIAELVFDSRRVAATIAELTGWLVDGGTHLADHAVVAGMIGQMRARLTDNRRTIRRLLWRERLEKARMGYGN